MTAKSDLLVNELIAAAIAFGREREPDWQTRIEDAKRELREYIDELEAEKECEMRVFKDGNAWCFVLPDFQDLQVSSSVWMKEGVLDKIYKELRSVRNERRNKNDIVTRQHK